MAKPKAPTAVEIEAALVDPWQARRTDADPAYIAARENVVKLEVRLRGVVASMQAEQHKPRSAADIADVAELLTGGSGVAAERFNPDAYHQLQSESHRLAVAIGLQRKACERLARDASRRICAAARTEHQQLIGDIAAAARALVAASAAELAFRQRLESCGLETIDLTPAVPAIPRSFVVPVECWAKTAAESGL